MRDADWLADRHLALTVQCRYCPSETGAVCVIPDGRGKWLPLRHLPAHVSRINDARRANA